jgi:cytochrome c peroxidase
MFALKKKYNFVVAGLTFATTIICLSFTQNNEEDIEALRKAYSSGDYSLWPKPILHENALANFKDIGVLDSMPYPADNKFSQEKKDLGKLLFFDPRLSSSGQIACASCHEPQLGWGDGKRVANGHDRKTGSRNAMTLLNVGFYEKYFWDGRANSLEDQARFPIKDHLEMNMDNKAMEKKIKKFKGYEPLFEKAFGSKEINLDRIYKAIATFERGIVSPPSRFDQFVKGKPTILKDEEVLGLHLFRTKAGCINCHNTPLFSNNKFHNDGQTLFASESEDLGRYNFTKQIIDVGKFKTPSLRETANTGPWMHHGNFPSLKDVVFFYDKGNPSPIQRKYKGDRDSLLPVTDVMLKKLNLQKKEVDALVAFLQCITTTPARLNPPTNFPN